MGADGRRAAATTGVRPGDQVLDACCGSGASAIPAAAAPARAAGSGTTGQAGESPAREPARRRNRRSCSRTATDHRRGWGPRGLRWERRAEPGSTLTRTAAAATPRTANPINGPISSAGELADRLGDAHRSEQVSRTSSGTASRYPTGRRCRISAGGQGATGVITAASSSAVTSVAYPSSRPGSPRTAARPAPVRSRSPWSPLHWPSSTPPDRAGAAGAPARPAAGRGPSGGRLSSPRPCAGWSAGATGQSAILNWDCRSDCSAARRHAGSERDGELSRESSSNGFTQIDQSLMITISRPHGGRSSRAARSTPW